MEHLRRNSFRASAALVGLLALSVQPARCQPDISGAWAVDIETQVSIFQHWTVTQTSGFVLSVDNGSETLFGTIDMDGSFGIQDTGTPQCPPTAFHLMLEPSGTRFTGTGESYVYFRGICIQLFGSVDGRRCGNQVVDAGEQCDDGNFADGDCCSSACQFESNGAACDDGNQCTDTACDGAGACAVTANRDGAACDDGVFCNGTDTCAGTECSVHSGDPCVGGPECQRTCEFFHCADPAGTPCTDDGLSCTADVCASGACTHPIATDHRECRPSVGPCDPPEFCDTTFPTCPLDIKISAGLPSVDCPLCETCDGAGGCAEIPQLAATCHQPSEAGASVFAARAGRSNRVAWMWNEGEEVLQSELGQPETTDDYDLCLYDESTPTPQILFAERVPHGVGWDRRSSGDPRYRDPSGQNGTMRSILTRTGEDGESRIRVRAHGPGLPALPLPFPLRLQLRVGQACFEAGFSSAERNDAGRVRARSD